MVGIDDLEISDRMKVILSIAIRNVAENGLLDNEQMKQEMFTEIINNMSAPDSIISYEDGSMESVWLLLAYAFMLQMAPTGIVVLEDSDPFEFLNELIDKVHKMNEETAEMVMAMKEKEDAGNTH